MITTFNCNIYLSIYISPFCASFLDPGLTPSTPTAIKDMHHGNVEQVELRGKRGKPESTTHQSPSSPSTRFGVHGHSKPQQQATVTAKEREEKSSGDRSTHAKALERLQGLETSMVVQESGPVRSRAGSKHPGHPN